MGEKKYKTYSAEYKVGKVEEYLKSGKSQRVFCEENGICLSTFRSWMDKSQISMAENGEQKPMSLIEVTDRIREAMDTIRPEERKIRFAVNGFTLEVESRDLPAFLNCMKNNG